MKAARHPSGCWHSCSCALCVVTENVQDLTESCQGRKIAANMNRLRFILHLAPPGLRPSRGLCFFWKVIFGEPQGSLFLP